MFAVTGGGNRGGGYYPWFTNLLSPFYFVPCLLSPLLADLYNTSNLLTTRGVTVLEFVRVSRGAILKEGVTLQSLSLYRQNSSFLNDLARVNNIASHGNQRAEALRTLLVAQSTNQSEAYLVDSVRVGAQFGMETLRAEQINVIRREILGEIYPLCSSSSQVCLSASERLDTLILTNLNVP